ncbi:MAG: hypothetical protein KAG61_10895 [Bacteriovoracaceae bacterium]|nr:hypothetical protein [Bacteriovoracaceae bacterium]
MKIASLLRRFLGVLADLCIATILFFYLFSFEIFGEFFNDIAQECSRYNLGIPTGGVVTALFLYFIHINLRFFETAICGVSVGQFLAGISAGGSFGWKRVGGCARVIFEFILSPFLIFDLPVLIRWRSLKEVLTFTALWSRPGVMAYLTPIIFIPCLIFMALISPLFENLTLLDGVKVSFFTAKKEKMADKTSFSNFKSYQSNIFHFSFFSSLGDGRYKIIPSYIVEKRNGEGIFTPYLSIYDTLNKVEISLKSMGDISLLDSLEHGKSFNPLFYARYPELAKVLARDRAVFKRKVYNSSFGNKMTLSQDVREEAKHLIASSFELSMPQVLDHVMTNGPFIKGHVEVRNNLLGKIRYEESPTVTMSQYGDHNFLVFTEQQKAKEGSTIIENFLGLESPRGIMFQLKIENSKNALKLLTELKKYLLASSNWYFDYNNVFSIPLAESDFTPFSIMDYIFDENITPLKRKVLEDYAYHYFFDLSVDAIKSKDNGHIHAVSAALNRQFLAGKIEWNHKVINSEYLGYIKTLRIALNNRDHSYFGL